MPPQDRKSIPPRQTFRRDFTPKKSPAVADVTESGPSALRVLAHVHTYPPHALTGGAYTMHHLLKFGEQRGWIPRVITDFPPVRADVYDGIPVRRDNRVTTIGIDYSTADVVLTHLNTSPKASEIALRKSKPLVHVVHNARQLTQYRVKARQCALAIFNSKFVADAAGWPGEQIILHPIVPSDTYRVDPLGEAVVMVNMTEDKGAPMFFELARKNPGVRFIGVKGTFGEQLRDPGILNLEIWEPQTDIRAAYAEARVVLMPSLRETWGRIAVEAAVSGIPSICSNTPGMLECGIASVYLEPHDIDGWNKALRKFTRGKKAWEEASGKTLEKSEALAGLVAAQAEEVCLRIENLV